MARALCPNCRKPLSENARFCMECGSRIDFGMFRKELGEDLTEDGGGLRVNRNEPASSPFYGKYNSLRDKIINPKLSPVPEKKSFSFKCWDEIKSSSDETEEIVFNRKPEEEMIASEPIKNKEQKDLTNLAEASATLKSELVEDAVADEVGKTTTEGTVELQEEIASSEELPEEVEQTDLVDRIEEPETIETESTKDAVSDGMEKVTTEETVGLQEEATDYDALKELFAETEEMPLEECKEAVSSEELSKKVGQIDLVEKIEEAKIIERESTEDTVSEVVEEVTTEETVGLQEEATDYDALKELFAETEEVPHEEECEETESTEELQVEVEKKDLVEKTEEPEIIEIESVEDTFSEKIEEVSADITLSEALERQEIVGAEEEKDYLANDFSEKICNQIDLNADTLETSSQKTTNRIITSTVGGGFRRRESQTEEVREITSLFGRKKKRINT